MDLATAIDAPPIARRLAHVIGRWAFDGIDGPLVAALRILSDPFIRSCIDRIAVLDARHQPVRWSDTSDVVVCACGSGAFDACPERLILDGRPL